MYLTLSLLLYNVSTHDITVTTGWLLNIKMNFYHKHIQILFKSIQYLCLILLTSQQCIKLMNLDLCWRIFSLLSETLWLIWLCSFTMKECTVFVDFESLELSTNLWNTRRNGHFALWISYQISLQSGSLSAC